MRNTKVKDLMTPRPVVIRPDATLAEAARIMQEMDCGILPVSEAKVLLGVVTDRDIVLRAVAAGQDPKRAKVAEVMTQSVCACNEEDFLEDAAMKMRAHKVSRLIVRDHAGSMTGILSFGAAAARG